MSYAARTPLIAGDAPSLADYNQGMANEAQLKAWVDDASKASLTNKSGGNLTAGAVVILDGDNDSAFKTTTVEADPRVLGALFVDIANNALGLVALQAKQHTVLVQGNVARGDFLVTSTTAGRAKSAGRIKPAVGAFAVATSAYSGGGAGSVSTILMDALTVGLLAGSLFSAGGYQGAVVSTTYKWDPVTDTTASVAGAALSSARRDALGGARSSLLGLIGGGFTTVEVSTVDKITFATQVAAATNSLPAVNQQMAGLHSQTDAYALWGGLSTTYRTTRYKGQLVNETWATLGAAAVARHMPAGGSGPDYGYAGGGLVSGYVANSALYRTAFATDIETLLSASLPANRAGHFGDITGVLGTYFVGGTDMTTIQSACYKLALATEAVSTVGTGALTTARAGGASGGNETAGYLLGGQTGAAIETIAGVSVIADKLVIGTETTSAISSANLPTATAHQGFAFG